MARGKLKIDPNSGKRIKLIRKELKILQKDFADKVGYTASYISRVENGSEALSRDAAQTIHKAFPRYRVEWLMGESDIMTEEELQAVIDRQHSEAREERSKREEKLYRMMGLKKGEGWLDSSEVKYRSEVFELKTMDVREKQKLFPILEQLAEQVGFSLERCPDGGAKLYKLVDSTGIENSDLYYHTKLSRLALSNLIVQVLGMTKVLLSGIDRLSEERYFNQPEGVIDPEEPYRPVDTFASEHPKAEGRPDHDPQKQ